MSVAHDAQRYVLGYTIERRQECDGGGATTTHYAVLCPRTGATLGRLASLRMAKRFVMMHELRDFSTRRKQARTMREMFAA